MRVVGSSLVATDVGENYVELEQEEVELLGEVSKLETVREDFMRKLTGFMSEINSVEEVKHVRGLCVAESEELMELQRQAQDLDKELKAKNSHQRDEQSNDSQQSDEQSNAGRGPNPRDKVRFKDTENIGRSNRRLLKKLFLKISMKTHPDKVKDPELNELFLEAKRMYEAQDVSGLQELWTLVSGGKIKRSRLMARLEKIRKRMAELQRELSEMLGSDAAQLMKIDVDHGRDHAVMLCTRGMRNDLNQMRMQKQMLKQAINGMKRKLGQKVEEDSHHVAPTQTFTITWTV